MFIIKAYDQINNWLQKEEINYKFNWFFLAFALICVVICYLFNNETGTIFSRSGSIIVLFGAVVEYSLSQIKPYTVSSNVSISGNKAITDREMPKIYKIQRTIAHLFIVFGTLIWGYGDYMTGTASL